MQMSFEAVVLPQTHTQQWELILGHLQFRVMLGFQRDFAHMEEEGRLLQRTEMLSTKRDQRDGI